MRLRVLLSDKEYLTSFIDMSSRIDKNLLIDLDFNGSLFDDELLVTDFSIDALSHQYPSLNHRAVCFLSSRYDEENITSGPFSVFKFQAFDDLISKIKVCSFIYSGGHNLSVSKCHKVGFMFDNDVYFSDFTEQFAKQIVYKYGVNVLILPLQFISSCKAGECCRYNDTSLFKKLIYYINKCEDIPIDSFFCKDTLGFYHFKSSLSVNPITAMDDRSFDKLIQYISVHFFDIICFDISRCLSKRNIDLLHRMDRVVVLSRNQSSDSSTFGLVTELGINNVTYVNPDMDGSRLEITINEMLDDVMSA